MLAKPNIPLSTSSRVPSRVPKRGVSKLVSVKFAQEEIEKQRREEKKSKVQSPPDKQGRKGSGSPFHSEKS